MPSLISKFKGILCISQDPGSEPDSRRPGSRDKPKPVADHDASDQGRKGSGASSSSASTAEPRRADHVLDVLRTFNLKNLRTVADVALVDVEGSPVDDKTYLMERIIQLVAELPVTSRTSATLTNAFLNQLWTDLQHPPQSYLGRDYVYRKADGTNNNILWPHLGAAGQPYARTVRPRLMQPTARPDPNVIFDTLLARKQFRPHPNKISSVLFYVASVIIHDIFHTNREDYSVSDTSSYLDLAPLYGSTQAEQDSMRTLHDGKLKPDCFADIRILGFPPGVGVLLIMFNRFHNHVAEKLALIDEYARFSSIRHPPGRPPPADAEKQYDEALFQTARLITTGLYVNIILKDYVRTILNLNRTDSLWNLDPRSDEGKALFGHKIPEATGNAVSAEFNLVYRWHACVSERDDQWTRDVYARMFGAATDTPLSLGAFLQALNKWAQGLSANPVKRLFAGLDRLADGRFADDGLAAIWTAAVSDVAGSYGAHHVPEALRNVEVLGIIQSRAWNLASLNEFRAYFKLAPHETFEDINPDPIVADQLRRLYGHPDHVEIYPGVVVEAAKEPKKPGSGLCTNFTTSRAILSDAVALVRGDRFYTVDYTPAHLTNWGFNEASYDLGINDGCVFYKLVLTTLPNNYRPDSVYAHFPLVIPAENKIIQADLKRSDLYNFDTPTSRAPRTVVTTVAAFQAVTTTPDVFEPLWSPQDFLPGHQQFHAQKPGPDLAQALLQSETLLTATHAFYRDGIADLAQSASYQLGGVRQVDIVHDVLNLVHARYVAALFQLPIDSRGSSRRQYTDAELISLLSAIFDCGNDELGPARRFVITTKRRNAICELARRIEEGMGVMHQDGGGSLFDAEKQLRTCAAGAIKDLAQRGWSTVDIIWTQLLPLAARTFVGQSRALAQGLDLLLDNHSARLQGLQSAADDAASSDRVQQCVRELREKRQALPLYRRATAATARLEPGGPGTLSRGQVVFCDPGDLGLSVDERATALGGEVALDAAVSQEALRAMLEALSPFHRLRRAPGAMGQVKRLTGETAVVTYLNVEESKEISIPVSMKVDWQG